MQQRYACALAAGFGTSGRAVHTTCMRVMAGFAGSGAILDGVPGLLCRGALFVAIALQLVARADRGVLTALGGAAEVLQHGPAVALHEALRGGTCLWMLP